MIKDYFLRPSLNRKLVAMMLFLSLSLMSVLIFLYYHTEKAMYNEFERHIAELSKAIRVGMEEASKSGATDETRLKDYLDRLNTKGVKEISIVSNSDRIVSSTDRKNIGKWIAKQKKELVFRADLGEQAAGEGSSYDVMIPVLSGDKHLGYINLRLSTEDFSVFLRAGAIRRIVAASMVFGVGIVLAFFLAKKYTKPIEDVVSAARAVAGGDLSPRLDTGRKDEIGELSRSFNFMVGRLRAERDLGERLRKAEHLASIGQFSGSIAHEIKNPLNFINLSIAHIKEKYGPSEGGEREKFESLISNIKKEIERVSKFSESFLEYSRPLELDRKPTDMARLVEGVLELASMKARVEDIEIRRRYGELPELFVDPEFIKTCLYNIIINAFEAMPVGGALTVGASEGLGYFLISVADTGKGIPPDKLQRVFEPFFTTKEKGLGLGLALTKRVVEEHGGKISVRSAEGAGTEVTIALPIVHAGHIGREA